ncbi:RGS domain-containing serine/threonine-protein kinase A (RGS domain-containing serine/threonine-protein kinase 1), partial [Durusdinium trenchii]
EKREIVEEAVGNLELTVLDLALLRDEGLSVQELAARRREEMERDDEAERLALRQALEGKEAQAEIAALGADSHSGSLEDNLQNLVVELCKAVDRDSCTVSGAEVSVDASLQLGRGWFGPTVQAEMSSSISGAGKRASLSKRRSLSKASIVGAEALGVEHQHGVVKELRKLVTIQHDNLVRIEGWCSINDTLWVLTEPCNMSLAAFLARRVSGSLSKGDKGVVESWSLGLARALAHLHSKQDILHGDVRPHNVMVDPLSRICKLRLPLGRPSQQLVGMAADAFSAPETLGEAPQWTHRADVFSFAMVCFVMAHEAYPWREFEEESRVILEHVTLEGVRPTVDEAAGKAFGVMLKHAWEQDVDLRPSSTQVVEYLKACGYGQAKRVSRVAVRRSSRFLRSLLRFGTKTTAPFTLPGALEESLEALEGKVVQMAERIKAMAARIDGDEHDLTEAEVLAVLEPLGELIATDMPSREMEDPVKWALRDKLWTEDAIGDLISLTKAQSESAAVQGHTCIILRFVSRVEDNVISEKLVHSMGGGAAVLDAMEAFRNDPFVQEKGCAALWSLVYPQRNNRGDFGDKVKALVLRTLEDFQDNPTVLTPCLATIWNLAVNADYARQLIDDRVHVTCMELFTRLPDSPGVHEKVCGLMWNLASTFSGEMADLGMADKMVAAMRRGFAYAPLQYRGFWALATLAIPYANLVYEAGGMDHSLHALRAHPFDESVVLGALRCIWNLSPRYGSKLVEADVGAYFIQVLQSHVQNEDVSTAVLAVLRNLTLVQEPGESAKSSLMAFHLVNLLKVHVENSQLCARVLDVMTKVMTGNVAFQRALRSHGLSQALAQASALSQNERAAVFGDLEIPGGRTAEQCPRTRGAQQEAAWELPCGRPSWCLDRQGQRGVCVVWWRMGRAKGTSDRQTFKVSGQPTVAGGMEAQGLDAGVELEVLWRDAAEAQEWLGALRTVAFRLVGRRLRKLLEGVQRQRAFVKILPHGSLLDVSDAVRRVHDVLFDLHEAGVADRELEKVVTLFNARRLRWRLHDAVVDLEVVLRATAVVAAPNARPRSRADIAEELEAEMSADEKSEDLVLEGLLGSKEVVAALPDSGEAGAVGSIDVAAFVARIMSQVDAALYSDIRADQVRFLEQEGAANVQQGWFGQLAKADLMLGPRDRTRVVAEDLTSLDVQHDVLKKLRQVRHIAHENLVRVHGVTTISRAPWIITEPYEMSLAEVVRRDVPLDVDTVLALKWMKGLARALEHLHDVEHLVHCDVRPHNVLVDAVKRSAKLRLPMRPLRGELMREDAFSAPETLGPKPKWTTRSDVYSFGMVAFVMSHQQDPWHDATGSRDTLFDPEGVVHVRPTIAPETPAHVADLMRLAWSHDVSKRPGFKQIVQFLKQHKRKTAARRSSNMLRNLVTFVSDRAPPFKYTPPPKVDDTESFESQVARLRWTTNQLLDLGLDQPEATTQRIVALLDPLSELLATDCDLRTDEPETKWELRVAFWELDPMGKVLEIMDVMGGSAAVSISGLVLVRFVTRISDSEPVVDKLINQLDVLDRVAQAMERHVTSGEVQEKACQAVRNLAFLEKFALQTYAMVKDHMLQAMKDHVGDAAVMGSCCEGLQNLAGSPALREEIVDFGFGEAIMEAMGRHEADADLQYRGLGALLNIGVDTVNEYKLMDLNVHATISKALKVSFVKPRMVTTAFGVVRNYSLHINSLAKWRDVGILRDIQKGLRMYPLIADLQLEGLVCYTHFVQSQKADLIAIDGHHDM